MSYTKEQIASLNRLRLTQRRNSGNIFPMRTFIGAVLVVAGLIGFANFVRLEVVSKYNYEKSYSQLWNLADKSSTIPAKEGYINQYVKALRAGQTNGAFAEYDAIWLKTPDNNFELNLKAVETLAQRLKEIQNMDPKSFEYNTAIQQITAQEQGEAQAMLSVIHGCYDLANYPLKWGWIGAVNLCGSIGAFALGILLAFWRQISDALMF